MKRYDASPLSKSVQYLKSIGPKRAEAFGKVGINTVNDLLFYFPFKYLDRSHLLTANQAYEYVYNGYDGEVTIIGRVVDKEKKFAKRKEILIVDLRDDSNFFECVWFQGVKFFYERFQTGFYFAVSGKPIISKFGKLQIIHPDFDRIADEESLEFFNTGKIIPFYRIPKELKVYNLGEFSLRKIIRSAVEEYSQHVEESLPEELVSKNNLMPRAKSIRELHFPSDVLASSKAMERFKYEELFYLEILVAMRKRNYKKQQNGVSFKIKSNLVSEFLKILPFTLTESQLEALHEIRVDMEKPEPMNRLLQGDVGSGKTIVALISMLIAADNEFQSVIMAPTEILADQHYKNICKLISKMNDAAKSKIGIGVLIGGQKKAERENILENISSGALKIVVGTHALFEENVQFKKLGLIIVDEQHRFGVVQRARLMNKGITPDVIVMSATPVPRTLSLTVYGDLDVSTITQLPKNRKPIKTYLRGEASLPKIYEFIISEIKNGVQSFIVYPLVEDSEKLELKAAETLYDELRKTFFRNINVGLIHGRMKWQEKEEIMLAFANKQFDVLISTTVIEVGIDIPSANIIVINNAERFGLAQLHQLRGRVGRSDVQAHCILVTTDLLASKTSQIKKLSEYLSSNEAERNKALIRLQSMVADNDGFKIAEVDLKMRGPGDIFGTQQSGFPPLKYADIVLDHEIILKAKADAFEIIESDPQLMSDANKVIRKNLLEHYSDNLKFAKIA